MSKRRIIGTGVVSLLLLGIAFSTASATRETVRLPGSRAAAVDRASYEGRLDGQTTLAITLSLKLRNRGSLVRFLADVQNPASAVYQRYLTMEEFVERYSPRTPDYQRVKEFLQLHGFHITDTWKNMITIGATASAATVERTFGVTMNRYRYEGREVYAASEAPAIPRQLADVVDGIIGLDNIYRYQTNHVLTQSSPVCDLSAMPTEFTPPPYGPPHFQEIYGLTIGPGKNDGAGQHIAIIIWDANIRKSDLQQFWTYYGVNQRIENIRVIGVGAPAPRFRGEAGDFELALDTQYASSFTAFSTQHRPMVASGTESSPVTGPKVTCYVAKDGYPNDLLKAEQRFVSDGRYPTGPKIASLSFGIGEIVQAVSSAETAVFQNAAAMGLTVCVASGDCGSLGGGWWDDLRPQPSWPASSPYVTAVGGTTLTAVQTGLSWKWLNETVWKYGCGWGVGAASSGGGSSLLFSKPAWQYGQGVPDSDHRHVPDISLNADPRFGYATAWYGYLYSVGGTSASSPSMASFFAGINQQRRAMNKPYLGQVNAALYELLRTQPSTFYHDILLGDNITYKAGPGYDLCTGVGSIKANALAQALVRQ